MKRLSVILLVILLSPVLANADGYSATTQWWDTVEVQSTDYSDYLKSVYEKKGYDFCSHLRGIYPGTQCDGTVVLLNLSPAKIRFDKNFLVTQILHQNEQLKASYIFQRFTGERSFMIYKGRNKINLRIDGDEGPRFTKANLPDVVVKARQVAKAENIKMPRHFYVHNILNEIYKFQYSHMELDMHQFMIDLVTDREFLSEVFSKANLERYLEKKPPVSTASQNNNNTLEGIIARYDIQISDEQSATGSRYCYISKRNYKRIPTQDLAAVSEYYSLKIVDE